MGSGNTCAKASLSRISKEDAILVIDDGHQSRKTTKEKIENAGIWKIIEEKKTI